MACDKVSNIVYKSTIYSLMIVLIISAILSCYAIFSSMFFYGIDKSSQIKRLEQLRLDAGEAINEQLFANFDLNAVNPQINQIQTIITHNSYKTLMPSVFFSLNSIYSFITENDVEGQYEHNTFTSQFNNGMRGLELDIRYEKGGFYIYHAPIVDKGTHSPDWNLALEEMLIWSNNNPNHVPITILLEIKDDPKGLNPNIKTMDQDLLAQLDESIVETMGRDKVLTPKDLMNDNNTLNEMVVNNEWPNLSDTLGKFIFLLHPHSECTDYLIDLDTTLATQTLLPVIRATDIEEYQDYAGILMHNSPDVDFIQGLVLDNYIIRTRMDAGILYDEERRLNAIASGAQLLTTDFAPDRVFPKTDYNAHLDEEYTIGLNPLFYD